MEGLPVRAKTSTRQSVFEDTSFTTQKLPLWITPDLPRITTDNLQRETSPSSSIFSSLLQDVIPSAQFEDIIPPTELQSVAHPVPSKEMNPSEVLSSDISPCSEVEAVLKASQNPPRKKARKRRRISSKLSLSQSSRQQQQQQQQHSQDEDDMQFLKNVVHISNSITNSSNNDTTTITSSSNTTTTTSTSISHKTNLGRSESLDPSRCINIPKQENSSESGSPFESSGLRGLSHPAKLPKQSGSVHTLKYRQIQSSQQGITESAGGNIIPVNNVAVCRQHMSNKTLGFQNKVSFQSPSETVVQSGSSHHERQDHERPRMLSSEKWKDDTLTSNTEDLDLSVYYEAHSHFSILDESCSGPSGVQSNPKHTAGQAVLPIKPNVDEDASRNSYSMKENYRISNSSSSSGFSTTEPESPLKNCVMLNKQQAATLMRQVHKASKMKNILGKQKQIRTYEAQLGSFQGKKQSRTSREKLAIIEGSQKRKGQDHVEVEPMVQNTRRLGQTIDAEVSSSTPEPLSEGELSDQQLQRTKRVHEEATLGWGNSTVSSTSSNSSSSSSSKVVITPVMKNCIQAVGNVLKDYFGGTVEDNLRLMQKNDFKLLKCLSELQVAEFSQPHLLSPRAAPL